eukprot:scaffold120369_cov35-Tisochrysis_lutea.AAC.4
MRCARTRATARATTIIRPSSSWRMSRSSMRTPVACTGNKKECPEVSSLATERTDGKVLTRCASRMIGDDSLAWTGQRQVRGMARLRRLEVAKLAVFFCRETLEDVHQRRI